MQAFFYEIALLNPPPRHISFPLEVPRPEVLPEAGDILLFSEEWANPVDQLFHMGDEVHLMKRTNDAPHGRLSSLGNWLAITRHGMSVWSNIEWLIATGTLKERQAKK